MVGAVRSEVDRTPDALLHWTAKQMTYDAADATAESSDELGARANMSKYLAAEAFFEAADAVV